MTDPRDRVLELALRRVLGPGPGARTAPAREAPELAVRVRVAWEREREAARRAPARSPGEVPGRTRGRGPRPGRPDARPGTRRRRRGWVPAGALAALGLLALGLWLGGRGGPAEPAPLAVARAEAWVLGRDAAGEPRLRPLPAGPVRADADRAPGPDAAPATASDGGPVLAAPAGGLDLTLAGRALRLDGAALVRLVPPAEGRVAGPDARPGPGPDSASPGSTSPDSTSPGSTLELLAGGLTVLPDGFGAAGAPADDAPAPAGPLALRLPGDARLTVPVGLGLTVRDARDGTPPATPAPDGPPLSARVAAARAGAPASPLGLWALELEGSGALELDAAGAVDARGRTRVAATPGDGPVWLATGDGPARLVDAALLGEFTAFLDAARAGDEKYESGRFPPFGRAAEGLMDAVRGEPALWQLRAERVAGLLEGTTVGALQRRHLLWWLLRDGSPRAVEVARALWLRDPEAFDAQAVVRLAELGVPEFEREVEAFFRFTDEDDTLDALPFALFQVLRGDERRVPDLYPVLEQARERPVEAGLAALVLRRRGLAEPYAEWRAGLLGWARDQVEQGGLEPAAFVARLVPWVDALAASDGVPPVAHALERAWFAGRAQEPLVTPDEVRGALDALGR